MIWRSLAALAFVLLLATPAAAHSLRVFVTAEGQTVRGYGFFVGGGRPRGADWQAAAGDRTLATGMTDDDGAFAFVLLGPVADDIVVTIDPGDGHAARATLPRERVAAPAPVPFPSSPPLASPGPASDPTEGNTASDPTHGDPASDPTQAKDVADRVTVPMPDPAQVEAAVDRAVARQVEPLLIRLEAMDARMRLTDLVSGGMAIFGLAGIALWLRGRGR